MDRTSYLDPAVIAAAATTPINIITTILVMIVFSLVGRAFWPVIGPWMLQQTERDFRFHMFRGVITISLILFLRGMYWDFVTPAYPGLRELLGGRQFAGVFNVLTALAGMDFIKARWYLIPDEERHKWKWFMAWMHPGRIKGARKEQ